MTVWNVEAGPVSVARRFWGFYRQYVHTATHAASAAALTGFGLLVFIDPIFVAIAVAAYVFPPLVLYALGAEMGAESGQLAAAGGGPAENSGPEAAPNYTGVRTTDSNGDPGDSDSDSGDGDTDSDGDDGDTDSDGDDGDTDSDGDDGDTDSDADSDDGDTDSDGSDTDTDS